MVLQKLLQALGLATAESSVETNASMVKKLSQRLSSRGNKRTITETAYGSWVSPLTSKALTAGAKKISLFSVAPSGDVFCVLSDPDDGGRIRVVKVDPTKSSEDQTPEEVTPADINVRTRVHEYGGVAYTPVGPTCGFAVDFATQRMFAYFGKDKPTMDVAPGHPFRYADLQFDGKRGAIVAVREDHTVDEPSKVVNQIVAIPVPDDVLAKLPGVDAATSCLKDTVVLAEGADFYMSPRMSPDGSKLSWVQWDHPNMPWDDTALWTSSLDASFNVSDVKQIAGQVPESVTTPLWVSNSKLIFATDRRAGWWNLHSWDTESGKLVCEWEQDTEVTNPQWTFGQSEYSVNPQDGTVIFRSKNADGHPTIVVLTPNGDASTNPHKEFLAPAEHSSVESLCAFTGADGSTKHILFGHGTPFHPTRLNMLTYSADGTNTTQELFAPVSSDKLIDAEYVSVPKEIEIPTVYNGKKDKTYGYLYKPCNPDFQAPAGTLPPLLVKIHGGPTAHTNGSYKLGIQYWTSRGFAVIDMNYGGSTGYGREYRFRLKDNWGIVDVQDCTAAANYLAGIDQELESGETLQGLRSPVVDKNKLAIDGGSAGGFTTLACLAFRDTFSAGTSLYGVSDLELLAKETHKFESRYLDGLIGKYPENQAVYKERSPINSLEGFKCPLLLLQGDEDEVVPPNQAQVMYDALRAKSIPVSLIMYQGEQHGFRKAENIISAYESEIAFYGRVFGFKPADNSVELEIANEDKL